MEKEILNQIQESYNKILGEKLTGIYVHGSIAFQCFNWNKSDIDFLVVVSEPLSLQEKQGLIETVLRLDPFCPKKGLEMSVVLERDCKPFVYPTPYELHYSNSYREQCKDNLQEYCMHMNGVDKDLGAHSMVINQAGIVLSGKPIDEVFGEVSSEDYLDSIKYDVENAVTDINENPVYVILNLCRALAYVKDGIVISKKDGGNWGLKNLPQKFHEVIAGAMAAYADEAAYQENRQLEHEFANYMYEQIFKQELGNLSFQ